jgi:uncharacterized protein YqkB
MNINFRFLILLILLGTACKQSAPEKEETATNEIPDALPMQELSLDDLSAFNNPGANWSIVGQVASDYTQEEDLGFAEGKGVLINQPTDAAKTNLLSNLEHGDLELEIEFLMPKGSNSGIYFQSRYELQLLDSWGKAEAGSGDCGGIYERWDDSKPEGEQGYDGHAPAVNACKAPGLWQKFQVYFRAPRFDEAGNKIKNARFESVYLNGMLIHKDVELSGPTRGAITEGGEEVAFAPLLIQGDHGPLAFRNIRYKRYTQDSLKLSNITYERFEGKWDKIPDFSQLTPTKTGSATSLDVNEASEMTDHYGLIFRGQLEVPVAGEYLFQTLIDDGGDLRIDSQLVVANEGDPGLGLEGGLVTLTEGTHDFEISFYEEVWFANITVFYEGPGIYKHTLASKDIVRDWDKNKEPLYHEPTDRPEMVRGFVNYDGEKRTHTISVGMPEGLHYSYDLSEGALLKVWRGGFADVTNMWVDRGESQLLLPRNAAIEATAGVPIAKLNNEDAAWPAYVSDDYRAMGYRIDERGRPIYRAKYKQVSVEDLISAEDNRIKRSIQLASDAAQSAYYIRLAAADLIDQMPNGEYRIDGKYYLKVEESGGEEPIHRVTKDGHDLLIPVLGNSSESKLVYSLLW